MSEVLRAVIMTYLFLIAKAVYSAVVYYVLYEYIIRREFDLPSVSFITICAIAYILEGLKSKQYNNQNREVITKD